MRRFGLHILPLIIGVILGPRIERQLRQSLQLGCGHKLSQFKENLAIVMDVLHEVQRDGITEEELQQAKSKILSRVVRSSERPMGRMQAIGMSWTYLRQYRSVDDELKAFDAVTLDKVRELLDSYPLDRVTTFALGPLETLKRPNGKA